MMAVDVEQRSELEAMIKDLEEENKYEITFFVNFILPVSSSHLNFHVCQ